MSGASLFTLQNTIVAGNGVGECSVSGAVTTSFTGNLVVENDNCTGIVSSADPQLGSLQANRGLTPTMVAPLTSPAHNSADPNVALPSDQRGQDRPAMGGFDIGAYELCLIGLPNDPIECPFDAVVENDPVELTILVAPPGSGTTTPPPGVHVENRNDVVVLSATPGTGYRFAGWTGNVANAASPSTTIVMGQAQTVTANFALLPDFTLAPINPMTISNGDSEPRIVTVIANATFSQPVSLSVSGAPAGVGWAFAPPSVTPPLGGTASSQLIISVGPSVLPGTYILDVVGTSGALTRTTPLSVTVVMTVAGVTRVVAALGTLGCIDNGGIVDAFTTKLTHAQSALDDGKVKTAGNHLQALLHQVQAQAGKHLKTSCTDSSGVQFNSATVLINQVSSLIGSVGATPHP